MLPAQLVPPLKCEIEEKAMNDPRDPFELPGLAGTELVYADSLLLSACRLASEYIAFRKTADTETAERSDTEIRALLDQEFWANQVDEKTQFRSRFMTLLADCNVAFGHGDLSHTQWPYPAQKP